MRIEISKDSHARYMKSVWSMLRSRLTKCFQVDLQHHQNYLLHSGCDCLANWNARGVPRASL